MSIYWFSTLMTVGCMLTLIGGLGVHLIENYNGRRLEAYCRLRRKPQRFGEVLDKQEAAFAAATYLLVTGLVVGSLAAGVWFAHQGRVEFAELAVLSQRGIVSHAVGAVGWWLANMLVGLWLPRMIVRQRTSPFLYHTWPFWKAVAYAASPLAVSAKIFDWLGQRLSDLPEDKELDEELLQDDIRNLVQAAQRDGVVSAVVPDMIEGVMQLRHVEVATIMTPRSSVDALDILQPWSELVRQAVECRRTRIPVYRGSVDQVIGILFVKDLLVQLASPETLGQSPAIESFLRKPWFIPGNKTVDELLRIFLHNRNHMAIVVDEYQQMMGVVTIEDALEEIVGEIADELDLEEDSQIVYDSQTHELEAEGKVPVERIRQILGIELPESDDYDTIGGLVIHRLSEIPKEGTQVDFAGLRITVLKATKRMVQRVRLQVVGAKGLEDKAHGQ
ncbi:MAG: HlyC/CorC family transporter [Pirellulaceae bacterium]|nr:HlyC/CorC family transporter [Pirellulaceae bacterium]